MSTEETHLAFAQRLRKRFIEKMAPDGEPLQHLTEDSKLGGMFLNALKHMDAQEIAIQRLDIDKDQTANDREFVMQQHQILLELSRQTGNPFERVVGNDRPAIDGTVEESALPTLDLVEGQMDKGYSGVHYDEFMASYNGNEEED